MVLGNPALLVVIPVEEREFGNPEEVEAVLRNEVMAVCDIKTDTPQRIARNPE